MYVKEIKTNCLISISLIIYLCLLLCYQLCFMSNDGTRFFSRQIKTQKSLFIGFIYLFSYKKALNHSLEKAML